MNTMKLNHEKNNGKGGSQPTNPHNIHIIMNFLPLDTPKVNKSFPL